jgi:hypothetical protein
VGVETASLVVVSRLYNQGGDDAEKSGAGGGTDSDSLNRTGPKQQCQLECTWVNEKGEKTKVTRSCHALNASDCANLGRAETGGNRT